MKRVCLFAGYDSRGIIQDYVVYYIQQMAQLADVYYMADCELQEGELEKLQPYVKGAYAYRHAKYDFGSWAELMNKHVGWETIRTYDQLILCNDSCYGPLYPLAPIFEKMEARGSDFWGLIQSTKIQRHLQSFFLVFNKQCLNHPALERYFSNIRQYSNLIDVILEYEIPLQRCLENYGFKSDALLKSVRGMYNLTKFPVSIYKNFGFPFLKVKAITSIKNGDNLEASGDLESFIVDRFPSYDSAYILNHVTPEIKEQFIRDQKDERQLSLQDFTYAVNVKILVHLHLFYQSQLPYFISKLKNLEGVDYDLIVTVVSDEERVTQILRESQIHAKVITVPNRGYDVASFLYVLNQIKLSDYTYVLKLHSKGFQSWNTQLLNRPLGAYSWRDHLVDSLLGSQQTLYNCLNSLASDPRMGMVASNYLILSHESYTSEARLRKISIEYERLTGEQVPPGQEFCFVAGTMFLVKASLLKPLITESSFDFGRFSVSEGTGGREFALAHLYERLFGLLMSIQGYYIAGSEANVGDLLIPELRQKEERQQAERLKQEQAWIKRLERKARRYKRTKRVLLAEAVLCVLALLIYLVSNFLG
jgi:rhamnosyltransferase